MRRIGLFPAGLALLLATGAIAGTPAPEPTAEQKAFAQKLNALPWAATPVVPITERAKLSSTLPCARSTRAAPISS